MRSLGKLDVSTERWLKRMKKWIYRSWFRSGFAVSYLDRLTILFSSSFFSAVHQVSWSWLTWCWLIRERNIVVLGSHDSTPTPELPVGACWLILSLRESGGWSDLYSSLGVTHLQLLKVCFRAKLKATKTSFASPPHPNWACMGEGNGVKSGKDFLSILLSHETTVCDVL